MRRLAAILLVGTFLALGAGALEYVHSFQHVHVEAHHDQDDPSECFLHALLHAPMLSASWVPLLVCLGLFLAFLTLLNERLEAARQLVRLDCRGPPALLPV